MVKALIGSFLTWGVLLGHCSGELRASDISPRTGDVESYDGLRLEVAQSFVKRMRSSRARHPERVPILMKLLLVEDVQLELKFLRRDLELFEQDGVLPVNRLQGFSTAEAAKNAMRARTDSLIVEMNAALQDINRLQTENNNIRLKKKLR